jgi:predicted DNA-binding protein (MmcQ/YjbR family)
MRGLRWAMTTSLDRLTAICLALREAERELQGDSRQHARFLVRNKTFAYYLHDHHGDGILGGAFKVGFGENEDLTSAYSDRYYVPPYIGSRGWVGIRLDTASVDWTEVDALARESYSLLAPKRLNQRLTREPNVP